MSGFFTNEYPYTDFHELNLSWIIEKVRKCLERLDSLEHWTAEHQKAYDDIKKLYDDLMAGNFPPSFINALKDYIEKYGVEIIAEKIKAVHFGLTNDGYFCAYIPESWEDIHFDTVSDYNDPLYGHLMLLYD